MKINKQMDISVKKLLELKLWWKWKQRKVQLLFEKYRDKRKKITLTQFEVNDFEQSRQSFKLFMLATTKEEL